MAAGPVQRACRAVAGWGQAQLASFTRASPLADDWLVAKTEMSQICSEGGRWAKSQLAPILDPSPRPTSSRLQPLGWGCLRCTQGLLGQGLPGRAVALWLRRWCCLQINTRSTPPSHQAGGCLSLRGCGHSPSTWHTPPSPASTAAGTSGGLPPPLGAPAMSAAVRGSKPA